ncbi:putative cAMP-binding protein-catabolite gene activator and regulatory subunit of cAMP-dependent protein kinase [Rhodospirillaceae bacterium LM-1]|nr:putative cAMP-binding protein-catabolite gene activator and regulatory subunit of cAMP-dependent protein kinase [Rhodospirillaceae bacterium LM-1]
MANSPSFPQLSGLAGRLPHDLDQALLAPFLSLSPTQQIESGTVLFLQGERATRFAWLEDGLAELFVTTGSGEELQLDLAARGAMLGDIAAATATPHLTAARALTPVKLRWIDAQSFRDRLSNDGHMVLGTLAGLCLRLRRLVSQIDEMKLRSGTRRLAGFLLELAGTEEGKASITLPFEKKTLAKHLGMTSQSLSRSLKALGTMGVSIKGRSFALADCQRLKEFHDQEGDSL